MTWRLFLSLSICILMCHTAMGIVEETGGRNLLKNPGFEQTTQDNRTPAHWIPINPEPPQLVSEQPQTGNHCALLIGDGKLHGWKQVIKNIPFKHLRLRVSFKVHALQMAPNDYVGIYGQIVYKDRPEQDFTYFRAKIPPGPGFYDWAEFLAYAKVNPSFEIEHIVLTVQAKFSGGKVWVDDLWLEEFPSMTKQEVLSHKIADVTANLQRIGNIDKSVPAALKLLQKANNILSVKKPDTEETNDLYLAAVATVSPKVWAKIYPEACVNKQVEARMAYGSIAPTAGGIDSDLDLLETGGFNGVYLTVGGWTGRGAWHKVVYHSDLIPTYDEYKDFDSLSYYIEQAHKRNIKVFVLFEMYRTHDGWDNPTDGIYVEHPEWFSRGPRKMPLFPDPAHPEVQRYIAQAYAELARRYDLDGLGFDFARYGGGALLNYDQNNQRQIMQRYGIDILKDDPYGDAAPWAKVTQYRSDKVLEGVELIIKEVHKIKPQMPFLHCAIRWPDWARDGLGQDWEKWCDLKLLDLLSPMNYDNIDAAQKGSANIERINRQKAAALKSDALFVPALGGIPKVHDYWTLTTWAQRLALQRKLGVDGIIVFALDYMDPAMISFFGKGPFRNKAHFPDFPKR